MINYNNEASNSKNQFIKILSDQKEKQIKELAQQQIENNLLSNSIMKQHIKDLIHNKQINRPNSLELLESDSQKPTERYEQIPMKNFKQIEETQIYNKGRNQHSQSQEFNLTHNYSKKIMSTQNLQQQNNQHQAKFLLKQLQNKQLIQNKNNNQYLQRRKDRSSTALLNKHQQKYKMRYENSSNERQKQILSYQLDNNQIFKQQKNILLSPQNLMRTMTSYDQKKQQNFNKDQLINQQILNQIDSQNFQNQSEKQKLTQLRKYSQKQYSDQLQKINMIKRQSGMNVCSQTNMNKQNQDESLKRQISLPNNQQPTSNQQSYLNIQNKMGVNSKRQFKVNQIIQIKGVRQKHIKDLYEAKCKDLQLNTYQQSFNRFIDFCQKTIQGRQIIMRECGLGINCAKVISNIIMGESISRIDVSKNNFGNQGLIELVKGIKNSLSLVHLDVGSNDINYEGATYLFKNLQNHPSISSLVMSNHDRLHRNRMGPKGCLELNKLLQTNDILSMLNIADNGIGNEGLKNLQPSLKINQALISLNLSNNDLLSYQVADYLSEFLRNNKQLIELNLSYNMKLGDLAVEELSNIFKENSCRLQRLDLSNCGLTSYSVGKLFYSIKNNCYMQVLRLDQNDLSSPKIEQISIFLWTNRKLSNLFMSQCQIETSCSTYIAEGLQKNRSLKLLDLSQNKLNPYSMKAWDHILGKCSLEHLDLSFNDIEHQGIQYLIDGLSIKESQQEMLNTPSLQILNIKGCSLGSQGGTVLQQYLVNKTNQLWKIQADCNGIHHKILDEIYNFCSKNKIEKKKEILPKYRQELNQLQDMERDNGYQLLEQRNNCFNQIRQLSKEKQQNETEYFKGEQILSFMQEQEQQNIKQLNEEKQNNLEVLEQLDQEIQKREKKVYHKEKYIQEQLDNIEKRMGYVQIKNTKVQDLINEEKIKIDDEHLKYKDVLDALKNQLEEANKDAHIAYLLQKTYIDQINRENQKLQDEQNQELDQNENNDNECNHKKINSTNKKYQIKKKNKPYLSNQKVHYMCQKHKNLKCKENICENKSSCKHITEIRKHSIRIPKEQRCLTLPAPSN